VASIGFRGLKRYNKLVVAIGKRRYVAQSSSGVIYSVVIRASACLPENMKEFIIKRHEGVKKYR
jgi:hypothetical protein